MSQKHSSLTDIIYLLIYMKIIVDKNTVIVLKCLKQYCISLKVSHVNIRNEHIK